MNDRSESVEHHARKKPGVAAVMAFRWRAALLVAGAVVSLASCGGGDGGGGAPSGPVMMPEAAVAASEQALAAQPVQASEPTPATQPGSTSEPVTAQGTTMTEQPAPTPAPTPVPIQTPVPAQTPPPPTQPVVNNVTLSGKATYDFVPNLSGPLLYADTVPRPIRGASVQVVDANDTLLATTTTDDRGAYAVSVPARTTLKVRVQAQTVRAGTAADPGWDVRVGDNTKNDALYALDSPEFPSGTVALTHNLHAASGWGSESYTGARMAAPFAVMDSIYTAMLKVVSVAPATQFPALKVFWSVNNVASQGDKALGQIGNSHHYRQPTGSEIYVLGDENKDTDEFDAHVIAHEWGHYYQYVFSRNDTPGGHHQDGDRLDARVAFSEGWGNAWSGIALERSNYTDSSGAQQGRGVTFDLQQAPTTNQGWYSEQSLQWIFWTLNERVGFRPIHEAMTSERFKGGTAFTTVHAFAVAFNAISAGNAPALAALLRAQQINDAPNDPFGLLETNAGGLPAVPDALPMHVELQVGAVTSACLTNVAGTNNKVGNYRFFHFTVASLPAGTRDHVWTLATKSTDANLDLDFYRGGALPKSRRGSSLVLFVQLAAGSDYLVAVHDKNRTEACFDLTINQR